MYRLPCSIEPTSTNHSSSCDVGGLNWTALSVQRTKAEVLIRYARWGQTETSIPESSAAGKCRGRPGRLWHPPARPTARTAERWVSWCSAASSISLPGARLRSGHYSPGRGRTAVRGVRAGTPVSHSGCQPKGTAAHLEWRRAWSSLMPLLHHRSPLPFFLCRGRSGSDVLIMLARPLST